MTKIKYVIPSGIGFSIHNVYAHVTKLANGYYSLVFDGGGFDGAAKFDPVFRCFYVS